VGDEVPYPTALNHLACRGLRGRMGITTPPHCLEPSLLEGSVGGCRSHHTPYPCLEPPSLLSPLEMPVHHALPAALNHLACSRPWEVQKSPHTLPHCLEPLACSGTGGCSHHTPYPTALNSLLEEPWEGGCRSHHTPYLPDHLQPARNQWGGCRVTTRLTPLP
jgi:hypothetical protein